MQHYVYVQDKNGSPLMPTTRYGWVRRALKAGKAVAVCTVPFTIRLTYEPETKKTQPIRMGNDEGRINIGYAAVRADGKCLMRIKVTTRNDKIAKLIAIRKSHRQAWIWMGAFVVCGKTPDFFYFFRHIYFASLFGQQAQPGKAATVRAGRIRHPVFAGVVQW